MPRNRGVHRTLQREINAIDKLTKDLHKLLINGEHPAEKIENWIRELKAEKEKFLQELRPRQPSPLPGSKEKENQNKVYKKKKDCIVKNVKDWLKRIE